MAALAYPMTKRKEERPMAARTLFDKIWDSHVVERLEDGTAIL